MIKVKPWQVWLADLNPPVGYEQGGVRPVVVVASRFRSTIPSSTTLVVPLTTRDRQLSHHVPITSAEAGLARPSWARTEDVMTVSFDRFRRDRPFGRVNGSETDQLRMWIMEMVDFDLDD